jgi:hypothetical protein
VQTFAKTGKGYTSLLLGFTATHHNAKDPPNAQMCEGFLNEVADMK